MPVRSWYSALASRRSRSQTPRSSAAADRQLHVRRLLLEGLEDRRLMAFDVLAEYATGHNPTDLALTQVDAGSHLDLVIANNAPGQGSVRLGNTDGTFGSPQSTGADAVSVVSGDFTGDGIADLVSINANLILQKGNGDGTFQAPVTISLPPQSPPDQPGASLPQSPRSIVAGDLNADGKLDLVVGGQTSFTDYYRVLQCGYYGCGYVGVWRTNTDGYVNVLIGNGNGGFHAPQVQPLGRSRSPGALAIGDLNGDGQADVLTANNNDLCALLGNGAGGLAAAVHSGNGSALKSLSLGDFNGDGRLDAVTAWSGSHSLSVQKGLGDGKFAPLADAYVGHVVNSAAVGDLNGDGKFDLAAAGTLFTCNDQGYYGCYDGDYQGQASVVLGRGTGSFSLPIASSLGTDFSAGFADMALADLTGDGRPDLVTIENTTGVAIVAANDGDWVEPVRLSITNASLVEGHGGATNLVFDVTLSATSPRDVTVDYATADLNVNEQYWYGGATATAGVDYEVTAGTLSIPAGQTSGQIMVPVFGDRVGEPSELLFLNLKNSKYANVDYPRATGTILDDEPYVAIQYYPSPEIPEGNAGTTSVNFEVILTSASDLPVTVEYYTQDGSALVGSDYQAATGTVTFAPGDTSETITVQVIGDTVQEWTEYFTVSLRNAANASLGNPAGYAYILDDDVPPTIAISDASVVEGNSGTQLMTFTVSLSNPSGQGVSVNYATANNSATTRNNDYAATSGSLYFALGETTQTITVTIKGDTKKEKDERFYVNLSSPDGATLADGRGVGTIVNDDGGGKAGRNVRDRNHADFARAVDAAIDDWMFPLQKKRSR